MFSNETSFRKRVGELLGTLGIMVQVREYALPERYRVDFLGSRNGQSVAIEVKFDRKGIADDLMKCSQLHRLPEFDGVFVAAPDILISADHIARAKALGVGLFGVREAEIKVHATSRILPPARLNGGWGYKSTAMPGDLITISATVENLGEKIARDVRAYCLLGHPFFRAGQPLVAIWPRLAPWETRQASLTVRVRATTREGSYPLCVGYSADLVGRREHTLEILVERPRS